MGKYRRLCSNDSLGGPVNLDSIDTTAPIEGLTFSNIHYKVANKHVLKGVSGSVPGGNLLAIMGCSGAGKSTMLDILASRAKHGVVTGKSNVVLHGGSTIIDILKPGSGKIAIGDADSAYGQLSGYVTQSDISIANLTVFETLSYTQRLLIGKSDFFVIQEILAILDLTEVQNTRVGSQLQRGISGGEARRLSIAIGLLYSPAILFVDEPTTNLDSLAALKCMKALKALCKRGHTVVCSIHQPRSNIYVLFDHLLLLHRGEVLYSGLTAYAVKYFSTYLKRTCPDFINPADFFLDMLEECAQEEPLEIDFESPDSDDELLSDADEFRSAGSPLPLILKQRVVETYRSPVASPTSARLRNSLTSLLELEGGGTTGTTPGGGGLDFTKRTSNNSVTFESDSKVPKPNEFAAVFRRSNAYNRVLKSIEDIEMDTEDAEHALPPKTVLGGGQISFVKQLYILIGRTWTDKRRNKTQMYMRTLGCIGISLAIGLMFLNSPKDGRHAWDRVNTINFGITVFLLFGVPAINKFIEDRLIVWADRSANLYGTLAYYWAVIIVELPILFIMSISYCSICYWMVGMKNDPVAFLYFIGVFTLVLNIGVAICQILAAIINRVPLAICLYMVFVAYEMLFGGFIVSIDSVSSKCNMLFQASTYYQATTGLFINEFEGCPFEASVFRNTHVGENPNKWTHFGILCLQYLVFRVLGYLLLRFGNIERR